MVTEAGHDSSKHHQDANRLDTKDGGGGDTDRELFGRTASRIARSSPPPCPSRTKPPTRLAHFLPCLRGPAPHEPVEKIKSLVLLTGRPGPCPTNEHGLNAEKGLRGTKTTYMILRILASVCAIPISLCVPKSRVVARSRGRPKVS